MNYQSSGTFQGTSDSAWVKSLVTGSILAFVLVSGTPVIRQMLRKRPKPSAMTPRFDDTMLESLRASVVGKSRSQIAQLLGPPHAFGTGEGTTWYYPVDDAEQMAMAIQFDGERVWDVDFF